MVDKLKTLELSKGTITLRDIKLKDSKFARSYAGRYGGFNEQDYYSKLYTLIADKDEKFMDDLNQEDDIKLVEAVKTMIVETSVSDAKKQ